MAEGDTPSVDVRVAVGLFQRARRPGGRRTWKSSARRRRTRARGMKPNSVEVLAINPSLALPAGGGGKDEAKTNKAGGDGGLLATVALGRRSPASSGPRLSRHQLRPRMRVAVCRSRTRGLTARSGAFPHAVGPPEQTEPMSPAKGAMHFPHAGWCPPGRVPRPRHGGAAGTRLQPGRDHRTAGDDRRTWLSNRTP